MSAGERDLGLSTSFGVAAGASADGSTLILKGGFEKIDYDKDSIEFADNNVGPDPEIKKIGK